jgi:hypothetical protein
MQGHSAFELLLATLQAALSWKAHAVEAGPGWVGTTRLGQRLHLTPGILTGGEAGRVEYRGRNTVAPQPSTRSGRPWPDKPPVSASTSNPGA